MKNRGIALKLVILILASITIIFSIVFAYNYFFSRRIITDNVEKNARNLAQSTVNRIDTVLLAVEKVPRSLAYFLEDVPYWGINIFDIIGSVVENNPEIYGASIAFEPNAYSANTSHFAPYVCRKNGELEFSYIPYDYFYWDWYQIPKELNRPAWTEPYFDEDAGGILMATYSMPFYQNINGKRRFMGVVTADISLTWLRETISSMKIGKTGYGFLISRNGTFVTHPESDLVMNETIFSVAEARNDDSLRELGRKMVRGNTGFSPFTSLVTGKQCWMVYAPLTSNGWSLGVLFPQAELMSDISRLNRTVLIISIAGFMIILVVIIWIAQSITKPLRALSRATQDIATGDLDVNIPLTKSRDEVGRLAESFIYMKDSLKKYISDLTEATVARERIEGELRVAHDIQMGILPKQFPAFPDRTEFDIYAELEPAKDVGGDLYDFFFMDENHLCFTVGDVSGKGVPAAIFMAITKTLIKTKATQGLSPEKIIMRVNEDLAIDNPSIMFVTLFLGILDVRTGEMEYCCGGHNPPYIIKARGAVESLPVINGIALGVMKEFEYGTSRIQLNPGDKLFLFTDGVTEAMDGNDDLFSEERLEKELESMKDRPISEILKHVMVRVKEFSGDLPQTDDITMMILEYTGKTE